MKNKISAHNLDIVLTEKRSEISYDVHNLIDIHGK